jgi:hypothetical protein
MTQAYISPLYLDPQRGVRIVEGLQAIGYKHLPAMLHGMATNKRYDLDFAQELLERETRLYQASKQVGQPVTNDPHRRTDDAFYQTFARWANIHRNWPAVLLKPPEMEAWKTYYFAEIDLCNQAGYYLAEVLAGSSYTIGVPKWLTDRVNHFSLFDEVSLAMLIKYRWYRITMSRFHKPDRLAQVEEEFKSATIHS